MTERSFQFRSSRSMIFEAFLWLSWHLWWNMSHWLALNWPDKFRYKLNRTNTKKETKKANREQQHQRHTFQVNEEQSKFPFNCVLSTPGWDLFLDKQKLLYIFSFFNSSSYFFFLPLQLPPFHEMMAFSIAVCTVYMLLCTDLLNSIENCRLMFTTFRFEFVKDLRELRGEYVSNRILSLSFGNVILHCSIFVYWFDILHTLLVETNESVVLISMGQNQSVTFFVTYNDAHSHSMRSVRSKKEIQAFYVLCISLKLHFMYKHFLCFDKNDDNSLTVERKWTIWI